MKKNTHIYKQPMELDYLTSSRSHNIIFYFDGRLRNNILFFTLPRNKRVTQKDTEASGGLAIHQITSPISIKVSTQL